MDVTGAVPDGRQEREVDQVDDRTAVDLLWKRSDWPSALAAYREAIRIANSAGAPPLRTYPGSPRITQLLLGERNRAIATKRSGRTSWA